jgi:hypothetical protein
MPFKHHPPVITSLGIFIGGMFTIFYHSPFPVGGKNGIVSPTVCGMVFQATSKI